jgi:DNA-binding LacI/PurR family transcriptional regulator
VPVVLFDRLGPEPAAGRAALANDEGMALLFEHLRSHGHDRIAYLGGYPGSTSADERRAAFWAAAARAGLRLPAGYARHGDAFWSEASGAAAVAELLREDEPPTALIAASDALAVGALRALHRAAVAVPDEVALVSFDDPLFADLFDPPLTALARHDRQLGALAAELLLQVLRGDAEQPEVRVPLELIVRRSCGCG